ncbi:MAG: carboxypeptidase regulatory-like domain-containing protein [Planctomycetes bacterium]|nr:carboxypeptidase regulatory-like domain-containing protein [Planctomycetota bacterium]
MNNRRLRRYLLITIFVFAIIIITIFWGSSAHSNFTLPTTPASRTAETREPATAAGRSESSPNPSSRTAAETIAINESDRSLFILRGRFIDEAGKPNAGVAVNLSVGMSLDAIRETKTKSDPGAGCTGTSGDDGKFIITIPLGRFAPPPWRPITVSIIIKPKGREDIFRSIHFQRESHSRDLGDIVLRAAGRVEGIVYDKSGDPIASGWSVRCLPADPPDQMVLNAPQDKPVSIPNALHVRRSTDFANHDGHFIIDGLAPGEYRLDATLGDGQKADPQMFTIKSGADTRSDVHFNSAVVGTALQVWLQAAGRPDGICGGVPKKNVLLIDSDSKIHIATGGERDEESSPSNYFIFEHLEPGREYTLQLNDARFAPIGDRRLRPGPDRVTIPLTCASGLRLRVFDGPDGTPIEHYYASVIITDSRDLPEGMKRAIKDGNKFFPRDENLLLLGESPPPDNLYHLPPGTYSLVVGAQDRGEESVDAGAIAVGETREVAVFLKGRLRLIGSVLRGNTPAANVSVYIMNAIVGGDAQPFQFQPAARVQSNEAGDFIVSGLRPGAYSVFATENDTIGSKPVSVTLTKDGAAPNIELTLPPARSLRIHAKGAPSEILQKLQVEARATSPRPSEAALLNYSILPGAERAVGFLDAKGDASVGPLAPGMIEVSVLIPGGGGMTASRRAGEIDLTGEPMEHSMELDISSFAPGFIQIRSPIDIQFTGMIGATRVPEKTDNFESSKSFEWQRTHAELGPLFPGQYIISLLTRGGSITLPGEVFLEPGATALREYNESFVDCSITCLDESTDNPIVISEVFISGTSTGGAQVSVTRKTGNDGEISLALPAGEYSIQSAKADVNSRVPIIWNSDAKTNHIKVKLRTHS